MSEANRRRHPSRLQGISTTSNGDRSRGQMSRPREASTAGQRAAWERLWRILLTPARSKIDVELGQPGTLSQQREPQKNSQGDVRSVRRDGLAKINQRVHLSMESIPCCADSQDTDESELPCSRPD